MSVPRWERKPASKLVFVASNSMRSQPDLFAEILPISRAKVPIVKFIHIPTGRYCDASFTSPQGVYNSYLLAFLLHLDPRALPIAVIIKFWAKIQKLTGTHFMSNYTLTLLVVFYLQQVNVLPSVYELQERLEPHQQCIVDHWETGFVHIPNYRPKGSKNELGLQDLVGGFFEYYSCYDFDRNIVSTFLGCSVKRELFISLNTVPAAFRLYDENLYNGFVAPLRTDGCMCVQDTFIHSRNCAVAVNKNLFSRIVDCFRHAAKCYKEKQSREFMRAILTVVPQPCVQKSIRTPPRKVPPRMVPQKSARYIPKVNNSRKGGFGFIKKFNEFQSKQKGKKRGQFITTVSLK